jgi:gas vesicle protein
MNPVVADTLAAVAGAVGGQVVVSTIKALRVKPGIDALARELRSALTTQSQESKTRGHELRETIEAQGKALREVIEAASRASEARDEQLQVEISSMDHRVRDLLAAFAGAKMAERSDEPF